MILYSLINFLLIIIPMLLNVAFVTLLERKILGLSQLRKGPNKVSFMGLTQPMADALKLFLKENVKPAFSNSYTFSASPMLSVFLAIWIWSLMPFLENSLTYYYSVILLIFIMSLGVYPLFLAGWSSNSKYALIGAVRGVAQTISYEISFALLLFSFLGVAGQISLFSLMSFNEHILFIWMMFPSLVFWLITCIAETNRAPFDFAEGESELVSGFNVEYGGSLFALIFMAEYASILFLATMTATLLGFTGSSSMSSSGVSVLMVFFWVWVRSTFPRYRYDKLMSLAWKTLLPGALFFIFSSISVSML